MVADVLKEGCHGIVIGNGLLALGLDAVSHLASLDHLLDVLDDEAFVVGNQFDEVEVLLGNLLGLVGWEDVTHFV